MFCQYRVSSFREDERVFDRMNRSNKKILSLNQFLTVHSYHTEYLKRYIMPENWGDKNENLYYHLNYTFKMCIAQDSIAVYTFPNHSKIAIFNIRLFKKTNKKQDSPLYLILRYRKNFSKKKDWYLPEINDPKNVVFYCQTKDEIKQKFSISDRHFPNWNDRLFNFNFGYRCSLDFQSIFATILNRRNSGSAKSIIKKALKNQLGLDIDVTKMKQGLVEPFKQAMQKVLDDKDKDYIVPGVFFDNKRRFGYSVYHQVLLNVEYPLNSGNYTKFVIVLEYYNYSYKFKQLLKFDMALKNGRLLKPLPKIWYPDEDQDDEQEKESKSNGDDDTDNNITPATSIDSSSNISSNVVEKKEIESDGDCKNKEKQILNFQNSKYPIVCNIKSINKLVYDEDSKTITDIIIETPLKLHNCGKDDMNHCQQIIKKKEKYIYEEAPTVQNYLRKYKELIVSIKHKQINHISHDAYIVIENTTHPKQETNTYYSIKNSTFYFNNNNNNISNINNNNNNNSNNNDINSLKINIPSSQQFPAFGINNTPIFVPSCPSLPLLFTPNNRINTINTLNTLNTLSTINSSNNNNNNNNTPVQNNYMRTQTPSQSATFPSPPFNSFNGDGKL